MEKKHITIHNTNYVLILYYIHAISPQRTYIITTTCFLF